MQRLLYNGYFTTTSHLLDIILQVSFAHLINNYLSHTCTPPNATGGGGFQGWRFGSPPLMSGGRGVDIIPPLTSRVPALVSSTITTPVPGLSYINQVNPKLLQLPSIPFSLRHILQMVRIYCIYRINCTWSVFIYPYYNGFHLYFAPPYIQRSDSKCFQYFTQYCSALRYRMRAVFVG